MFLEKPAAVSQRATLLLVGACRAFEHDSLSDTGIKFVVSLEFEILKLHQ